MTDAASVTPDHTAPATPAPATPAPAALTRATPTSAAPAPATPTPATHAPAAPATSLPPVPTLTEVRPVPATPAVPVPAPVPSGAPTVLPDEHTYTADELFFSTTDSAGRIRRANAIFMRLSGYPRGALVGRAHNVVRHPDMPAGAFRSIWEDLEAGNAASAYITNRSSDRGRYRVFATIVPSGDGYLSVRTLPMLTGLRDAVEAAYTRVREVEAASAASGSTRREVAAAGQAALLTELGALGYRGTVDFTRQTLPAEVAALVASGVNIPRRPDATGPVATILAQMDGIEEGTAGMVSLLDVLARLVGLLGRRASAVTALSDRLGRLRESLRGVVADVERLAPGEADAVRLRYRQVDSLVLECFEELRPLAGQITELRGDVDSVRFGIALTRLHNLAAGFFALQILDGQDALEENDAVGSLAELVSALSDGAASLTDRLALLDARRELVGGDLDAVAQALTATHAPLLDLLETADLAGAGRCQSVDAARALLGDGFPEVLDLADLAGAVRDLAVPYEAEDLRERLRQVREALAEL